MPKPQHVPAGNLIENEYGTKNEARTGIYPLLAVAVKCDACDFRVSIIFLEHFDCFGHTRMRT